MSWTTEWMRDWMNEAKSGGLRRTQVELAKMAGLTPANVSRWLSQQSKPDQRSIDAIIACLDEADALKLTRAWLLDHTPAAMKDRLESERHPAFAAPADAGGGGFPAGMSGDLKEKLQHLGRLAMGRPELRRILLDLVHALSLPIGGKVDLAGETSNLEAR